MSDVNLFSEEGMRVADKAVKDFSDHCPDIVMTLAQWRRLTNDISYQVAVKLRDKADEAKATS